LSRVDWPAENERGQWQYARVDMFVLAVERCRNVSFEDLRQMVRRALVDHNSDLAVIENAS
jgi:hypothetical protein